MRFILLVLCPSLTAEVSLKGEDIDPDMIKTLEVYWKVKVEYIVNLPPKYAHRSRKGLECNAQGACKGTDGFLIPVPDPADPTKDWIEKTGPTYKVDWGDNFGGGILQITAKTTVFGIEVSDTYEGKIEGETFNNTFKDQITTYLESPKADEKSPTIRDEVGYNKFFRVIAYIETRYRHFYPSIYGVPKDAIYPRENSEGDGGFGVMQLTIPAPNYQQIWNYQNNIDGAIDLIRTKLDTAKKYPDKVRAQGCTEQPYINKKGNWVYPCRPMPVTEKDKNATDFKDYQLRMDVYSLYNSNWHYWIWDKKKGWQPWKSNIESQQRGFRYANDARGIETKSPTDF